MKTLLPILGLIILLSSCGNRDETENYKKELPSYSDADSLENQAKEEPKKTVALKVPTLQPVNEAGKDALLEATIEGLQQVVEDKDVTGLMGFIDDNIKASFGGHSGHSDFKEYWKLNSTEVKNSPVWQELNDILSLGGTFNDEDNFSMPYVFTNFPAEYDPVDYHAITGENVRMRDQPSLDGKVLDALSYEIVKVNYQDNPKKQTINGETYPWVEIIRRNEEKGYVYGKFVRSPIDYRLNFAKKNGKWKITFFVVGD